MSIPLAPTHRKLWCHIFWLVVLSYLTNKHVHLINIIIKQFLVTCAPLNFQLGFVNYTPCAHNGEYMVGTVASISCNCGFHQSGPKSRTCQTNGNWNGRNPICDGFSIYSLSSCRHITLILFLWHPNYSVTCDSLINI